MAKKTPQKTAEYTIDSAIASLSPELKAEFEELCAFRPRATEIERWWNRHGYPITYNQAHYWFKKYHPPGAKAIAIAKSVEHYTGLDPRAVAGMAMAASAKVLGEVLTMIDERGSLGAIFDEDPKGAIGMLPAILREARSASQQYHQMTAPENLQEATISGAYAMAEELKLVFKDTAFESALTDAIAGGLLKLEGN